MVIEISKSKCLNIDYREVDFWILELVKWLEFKCKIDGYLGWRGIMNRG